MSPLISSSLTPSKMFEPNDITEDGIVISKDENPAKQNEPIDFTDDGIVIFLIGK